MRTSLLTTSLTANWLTLALQLSTSLARSSAPSTGLWSTARLRFSRAAPMRAQSWRCGPWVSCSTSSCLEKTLSMMQMTPWGQSFTLLTMTFLPAAGIWWRAAWMLTLRREHHCGISRNMPGSTSQSLPQIIVSMMSSHALSQSWDPALTIRTFLSLLLTFARYRYYLS